MSTILTDDEIADTFKNLLGYFMAPTFDDRKFARAIESAVLAELARQEPVGHLRSDPDDGHVFVPRIEGDWSALGNDLYLHPAPQQAERLRVPDGWHFAFGGNGEVLVSAPGCDPGSTWVKNQGPLAQRLLYALASDLAAAPEAPAQASAVDERAIDAAARKIAECMDYPWEHMPEKGRSTMRDHAKAVLDAARAALAQKGDAA